MVGGTIGPTFMQWPSANIPSAVHHVLANAGHLAYLAPDDSSGCCAFAQSRRPPTDDRTRSQTWAISTFDAKTK